MAMVKVGYANGIPLYQCKGESFGISPKDSDAVLSVGMRFRCGGTTNVWRITAIDPPKQTVTVIRESDGSRVFSGGDYFVWNYRSVLAQGIALTHGSMS